MNKKTLLLIVLAAIVLGAAGYYFLTQQSRNEQQVLQSTYDISKEYLALRYRTDDLLMNAREYGDYAAWDADMTVLIQDWERLANETQKIEQSANNVAEAVALNRALVQSANAYTAQEISNIYDKAPKFKGIATLANHLGVDAKRAQVILDKAQAEISSGVFSEEGDAFETLENTAIVVKDGCKVAGFVGGVVLTGGAAGIATAGTLTKVGMVVVGTDLALEVTEDGAQIAFGDRNKVSSFVKDVRTVTEPIATVISITNVPSNLGTAFGKFDSVMLGLEQFRDSVQEGKVVGIDLTNFEYHKPFQRIRQAQYPGTVSAAEMEMAEVEEWLKSLNKEFTPMTQEEVREFLGTASKAPEKDERPVETMEEPNTEAAETPETEEAIDPSAAEEDVISPTEDQPQEAAVGAVSAQGIAGNYSGTATLQHVEEDVEADDSLAVTLQLNEAGTGTATVYGHSGEAQYAGSNVSFSVSMKEGGAVVNTVFTGKASKNGSQTVISGDMNVVMMGVTIASYALSMQ